MVDREEQHFFEIIGTVLVRQSMSNGIIKCIVVRTRARRFDDHVEFVELRSGSDHYLVRTWFEDWNNDRDNHRFDPATGDSGRLVDIAIPTKVYDDVAGSDVYVGQMIYAVKVGDNWVSTLWLNPNEQQHRHLLHSQWS